MTAKKRGRRQATKTKASKAPKASPFALTDRQQRFVAEYLVDLNATAAYQRAGYKARGDVAKAAASRLLTNVNVQAAIAAGRKASAERTEITQDYVLKRLQREAEYDNDNASHAARIAALKLLGQHLGMFGEDDGGRTAPPIIQTIEVVVSQSQAPPPCPN